MWLRGGQHLGPSCDICLVELWGALLMMMRIAENLQTYRHPVDCVYMIIDNKPVVEWLAGCSSTQHDYVRDLVVRVYGILSKINTAFDIVFALQWTRRGIWPGNNDADAQAKRAVRRVSRDIPKDYVAFTHGATKTAIKRKLHARRRQRYEEEARSNTHLLSRRFFAWNLTQSPTFRPKDDHKMLTLRQSRIITQLRTGHSKCFFSDHVLQHHGAYSLAWNHCHGDIAQLPTIQCTGTCCLQNNNGKCRSCNVWETEEHFLLVCPSHARIRARTFGRFLRLYATWQEPVTLKSLLFPPLCFAWKHRKMILSNIVVCALETGRFKRW